jgi:hypothetical protein
MIIYILRRKTSGLSRLTALEGVFTSNSTVSFDYRRFYTTLMDSWDFTMTMGNFPR